MAISIQKMIFRDIILYFTLALLICVLSVTSIGVYSYFNFKQLTNSEASSALEASFAYEHENLGHVNSLHSIWTKAYENVALSYNDAWIQDNICTDVSEKFGIDLAVILKDDGTIRFAGTRGRSLNTKKYQRTFGPAMKELLNTSRSGRMNMSLFKETMLLDGVPYMLTMGEIQPSYDAPMRVSTSQPAHFLILAQRLDTTIVRSIQRFTNITNLRYTYNLEDVDKSNENYFKIKNDYQTIGYFAWTAGENARAILEQLLPVSIIALMVLIVLAFLVTMNVSRAGLSYDRLIGNLQETSKDLKVARDAAERSSNNKSKFLATMSHEIRTPMNGIVGMLSLLRETALSQQQIAYVNTIQSSSNSLMKLIDDVLEFSQSENKEQKAVLMPVNVREIVTDIQGLLQPVAIQRDLKFEIFFSKNVPREVITDGVRFRQILLHLTSNAFKFTQVGHVRINVNLAPLDSSTYELIVQVIDTGAGLPESMRDSLLSDTFSRDAINRNTSSQGLGLGIAQNLVHMLGGKIDYDSKPGQGSVFWFSIPVKKVASDSNK